MKKHEWRIVRLYESMYGENGPTLQDWLYRLESEGWEIFSVTRTQIVARKPFHPAPMRTEDR